MAIKVQKERWMEKNEIKGKTLTKSFWLMRLSYANVFALKVFTKKKRFVGDYRGGVLDGFYMFIFAYFEKVYALLCF